MRNTVATVTCQRSEDSYSSPTWLGARLGSAACGIMTGLAGGVSYFSSDPEVSLYNRCIQANQSVHPKYGKRLQVPTSHTNLKHSPYETTACFR